MKPEETAKQPQFTPKEQRFIDSYIQCGNATRAAKDAGYSKNTAYSIGWENLRKPEIRTAIDEGLKNRTLTPDETLKSITDIAKANLNDYLVIRKEVRTSKIEKHLSEIIFDIQAQIEDAEKLIERSGIKTKKVLDAHRKEMDRLKLDIIRLEIELERNPKAKRFVDGPAELVEVAELDLAKLARDKEAGRLKTFSVNEYGIKVEMYPADAALRDLARVHGLFEKDNNQTAPKLLKVGFATDDE